MSRLPDSLMPKPEEITPPQPPIDKGPLTPVEYIRHWIKATGSSAGAKIDKAKRMKRSDLTKEDAEFLLRHGITKSQIAQQYAIPNGSMAYVFQQLSVEAPKSVPLSKEEFKNRLQSAQSTDTNPNLINENDIIWFDKPGKFAKISTKPQIRIIENCITLNAAFMQGFGDVEYVRIGIVKDSCKIVISAAADDALKLRRPSKSENSKMRLLRNSSFIKTLISLGATLPIVYHMEPATSGMWVGSTEQIFRK